MGIKMRNFPADPLTLISNLDIKKIKREAKASLKFYRSMFRYLLSYHLDSLLILSILSDRALNISTIYLDTTRM
ncbi:MAG: hypothetical protein DRG31_06995 [Deltaproteobacteria bacterium]|nr:MAG: hypothetical protein DRG31_06995 [Deltaproteobacteria bacterium]